VLSATPGGRPDLGPRRRRWGPRPPLLGRSSARSDHGSATARFHTPFRRNCHQFKMMHLRIVSGDSARLTTRVTRAGDCTKYFGDDLTALSHGYTPLDVPDPRRRGAVCSALSVARGIVPRTLSETYGCGEPPTGRERPRGGAAFALLARPVALRDLHVEFATSTPAPFPAPAAGMVDTTAITPCSHPCELRTGTGKSSVRDAAASIKVRFTSAASVIIAPQTLHGAAARRNARAVSACRHPLDGRPATSGGAYHAPTGRPCSTPRHLVGHTREHTPEQNRAHHRDHRTELAAATPLRDLPRCGGGAAACSPCPHPLAPSLGAPRERPLQDVRTRTESGSVRLRGGHHSHVESAVTPTGLPASLAAQELYR
jgi:hypothetical protein